MNKTKLAVFCIILVVIMCQMAIDAGPTLIQHGQDTTSFRTVNTTQRSAFQRTQASGGRSSGAGAQQGQRRNRKGDVSWRGGRRNEGGNRPCRGDRCPVASSTGKASASSNASSDESED